MSNLAYDLTAKKQMHEAPKQQVKVKIKSKISFGEKLIYMVLFVSLVLGLTFIVANNAKLFQMNHDIHKLEQSIQQQEKINSGLELQVSELSNPKRIIKIASEQGLTLNNNNVKIINN